MNSWNAFARLEHFEVKGGSLVALVSLGNPPIPKDGQQKLSTKQTFVRMPTDFLRDFDEEGIEIGSYVELFGNIGGIVKPNPETNQINAYPQIILKGLSKAVPVGCDAVDSFPNTCRLAVLVKFIPEISGEDVTDPAKPLVIYAQVSAKRERPKAGEVDTVRTTDTIPLPCYGKAKEEFVKLGNDALNRAFMVTGSISGRISHIRRKDSTETREDLNPVVSILQASAIQLLPQRMFTTMVQKETN